MKRLLAMLLAVGLVGCGSRENVYQDQPVSFWLNELDQQNDPALCANVVNLLADVGKSDPTVVAGLIKSVKSGSFNAADVLARIGPVGEQQPKDVVAALAEGLKMKGNARNSLRLACARAIPKFGTASKAAVPALLEMLKDEDPVMRAQAAKTLGMLPPSAAQEATPALLTAARSDLALEVQHNAIEALKAIDHKLIEPPLKPNP